MAYSGIKYETPEEDLTESMRALGNEVQLTTFKTNQQDGQSQDYMPETRKLGIVCVGACNFWDKIVYIRHYLGEKPSISDSNCIVGFETVIKDVKWHQENLSVEIDTEADSSTCKSNQRREEETEQCDNNYTRKIPVEMHLSVLGQRLPDRLARLYLGRRKTKVGIIGAIVFCPASTTTLRPAVEWKNVIEEALGPAKKIPIILLIENINSSVRWIGEGNFVEDEDAMKQFCCENGFVNWFEILESDWKFGEMNMFGRAVDTILKQEQCRR